MADFDKSTYREELETPSHAPIEDPWRAMMTEVGRALDQVFNGGKTPKRMGFVLLTFPYGDSDGRCNYLSNGADRKDIVKLLREQAARFEAGIDMGIV